MTTHMSWFSRVYSSGTDLERLSKNGSRLRPRRSGATDQASTGSSNTNVATSRTGSAHASAARLRTSTIWIRLFSLLSVSAILLNISLWIFLGIQTGQRDGWFRKDHEKRLGFAAAVCFGVMVVATPAVVSVLAKNSRLPDKLKTSHIVDSLNGTLCWALPLIYIFTGAVPRYYDHPSWELTTQYVNSVSAPGFAVLDGYNDAAAAHVISNWRCTFPYSKTCNQAWAKQEVINLEFYSNLTPYVFDGTGNSTLSFNQASDDLVLQLLVNYDHSLLQHSYFENATQAPYLLASMYDARLPDLGKAIDCGLIALTEIPALASNTLMFTASYIIDDRDMIFKSLDLPGTCEDTFRSAYELHDPPYTSYSFHIATMPITDTSLCDTSKNSEASCVQQNILRLEKHVIDQMESKPGVEPKDIWLNVAAIVGGVQFLAWWISAVVEAVSKK